MTHLSVNVNKLATLRNSREKNLPDVTKMAEKILRFGAHGITVHPRPDGRHIRWPDVKSLHALITKWNLNTPLRQVEFNIEGFPSTEFMELIEEIKPDQCTLVPDPPEALTSNAGWDLVAHEALLAQIVVGIQNSGCRVSLFVDPTAFDSAQSAALKRLNPKNIELYTEAYAENFATVQQDSITACYRAVAQTAQELKIGVNAGHDLNQANLGHLVTHIPWLQEVSIGHALICEALDDGMQKTIENYLRILQWA